MDKPFNTINRKYFVKITFGDNVRVFETRDLAQSISDIKPEVIKNRVTIKVDWHDKSVEKVLFVLRARRIFNNPLTAKIFARDIERALI